MGKLKINTNKSKLFWFFIVIGTVLAAVAVLLAPLWDGTDVPFKSWGANIINILIAAVIVLYLVAYLWKKIISGGSGMIKFLTIVEFTVLTLIAVGCVFSQFNIIPLKEVCRIFGLILWCEGVIEAFRSFYYRKSGEGRYPVWKLVVALIAVTFGTYCFAKPFIDNVVILWIFVLALFALGIFFIALGIMKKPAKVVVKSV